MSRTLTLLLLASAVAGCATTGSRTADVPARGVEPVNVPVLTRADYMFDVAVPDGALSPTEAARLDGWFRSLDLGYGDSIYIDSAYASQAREDVARIAGNYGLLVSNGAPVSAGRAVPGSVRVIVSRTSATVPGCPNWTVPSQPSLGNETMSGFGCAVNGALAAMVANPQDLVHGREGSGVADNRTSTKALQYYRSTPPTGTNGLKDISTKKGN